MRQSAGYPVKIGAMFWTIEADRRGNYNFSNAVDPQLHQAGIRAGRRWLL